MFSIRCVLVISRYSPSRLLLAISTVTPPYTANQTQYSFLPHTGAVVVVLLVVLIVDVIVVVIVVVFMVVVVWVGWAVMRTNYVRVESVLVV